MPLMYPKRGIFSRNHKLSPQQEDRSWDLEETYIIVQACNMVSLCTA